MKAIHFVNSYAATTALSWLVGLVLLFRHGLGRGNPHLHNAIMDWPMYMVLLPFWAPLVYVAVAALIAAVFTLEF